MRNRFDHMAKQIGQQALNAVGTTVIQDAINPETQYADLRHEPDPLRESERHRLGLLGQLAAWPCLIEVYSKAPNAEEFRACLLCRTRHNRHTAATQMLRHGASLPEIGHVLRHRHLDTTAIYAKVDFAALRTVAQPWPGDAP